MAIRVVGAVYWLRGDHPSTSSGYHLGSASMTTNAGGQKLALSEAEGVAELRYLPFGETRWAWGVTPTDRRYTGQREVPAIGLYDYNARMYWPAVGRFVSADTVVPGPGNPQAFNRYMYVVGNPLRFIDPTGHWEKDEDLLKAFGYESWNDPDWQRFWTSLNDETRKMLRSKEFDFGAGMVGVIDGQTRQFVVAQLESGKAAMWELTEGSVGNYELGLQGFLERATAWAGWKDSGDGSDPYMVYVGPPDWHQQGGHFAQPKFDPYQHMQPFGPEGWQTQLVVAQTVDVGAMVVDVAMVGLVIVGGKAMGIIGILGGAAFDLLAFAPSSRLVQEGGWVSKRTPIIWEWSDEACQISPACTGRP